MNWNKQPLRVLVIGQTTPDNSIALKLAQSPLVEKVFVVIGKTGTKIRKPRIYNLHFEQDDLRGIRQLA